MATAVAVDAIFLAREEGESALLRIGGVSAHPSLALGPGGDFSIGLGGRF